MLKNITFNIKWLYGHMQGYKLSIFIMTILFSILSLNSIAIAVVSKKLVDAATSGNKNFIYGLLISYIAIVVAGIILGTVNSLLNANLWQSMSIKIRIGLYKKLTGSYWLDFTKLHSGDYVSRFTQDIAVVTSGIVDDIPNMLSAAVQFIAAFAVLAYYQPLIAVFTFVFSPIVFILSRFYSKKLKVTYKAIQEIDSEINGRLQEYFHNIQILKVYNLEEMSSKILEDTYIEKKKVVIKNTFLSNMMNVFKSICSWGGYFLAYAVGIFGIYNGSISFGVLVVFLQLFNQVQQPLSGLAGSLPKITACFVSVERLIELEKLKQDECKNYINTPSNISVNIENVSFSYPERENQLVDINFKAEKGEVVLLMGKSGSGKTTLIRLILSLINPSSGKIFFVDEHNNAFNADAGNRKWVSYVPQGNSLFSGTIASNIRNGNPSASDEEIISALVSAEAFEFVSSLKDGIYSVIGELGVGISEGQAQRIAIARALVSSAPAVIFDEVTSGLDSETERKVMENVKRDFSHKTLIVITHRESVKEYADRIYYIKNGNLTQEYMR